MGVEKKRCPVCKKRRMKVSASAVGTQYQHPGHKKWQMVDGVMTCPICIERVTKKKEEKADAVPTDHTSQR